MTIEEIYKKGTSKQLWEKWDASQRTHFLIDHYDMFGTELESDVNKYAQKFSHSSYADLPQPIKKQVVIHHAMGFYNEGGRVGAKTEQIKRDIISVKNTLKKNEEADVSEELNSIHERLMKQGIVEEQEDYLLKATDVEQADFYLDKIKKSLNPKSAMKYLTPAKKQLHSIITSIKEQMEEENDPQVRESVNAHLQKAEAILHSKTSTSAKIEKWKAEKKAKRLSRK